MACIRYGGQGACVRPLGLLSSAAAVARIALKPSARGQLAGVGATTSSTVLTSRSLSCNGTHVVRARARDARLRTAQVCPARRTRRAPYAARAEMPAHSRRVVRARLAVEGVANASPCSALRKLGHANPAPARARCTAQPRPSAKSSYCTRSLLPPLTTHLVPASVCTVSTFALKNGNRASATPAAALRCPRSRIHGRLRARFAAERAANALDVRPCLRFALAGGGEDDPASATQARRRVRTVASHSARYSRWSAAGGGVRPHPLREVRMCTVARCRYPGRPQVSSDLDPAEP
ncbi:hypothetical protein FB451DRAFT_1412411 [Mycena latifolia]|nr:hypothetical protein FB451DRAFT_1412411 [Mycena latifolia]